MATENMVKAGRAGLTFGGDWNEAVEYERLVGVRYDNKLFFSKKPVPIGLIPEDGEYWFLAYEGLTDAEWESILNGTQQVGDSAKLGGKDASEYAEKTELELYSPTEYVGNTEEEIDAIYNSLHENTPNGTLYRARVQHNAQHSVLGGGTFYVDGFRATAKYGTQKVTSYNSGEGTKEFTRSLVNTVWNNWGSDLPLSGGTVESSIDTPLTLKSKTAGVNIRLLNNEGIGWYFGFSDSSGEPRITGKGYLLHTGNKPSGSYTGNGSATSRTINVGGVSKVLMIQNSINGNALVDEYGALLLPLVGNIQRLSRAECSFKNGVLTMATENVVVNRNGSEFDYHSL